MVRLVVPALLLLAWTATASAECVWLLWVAEQDFISDTSTGEKIWKTPLVYPDRQACVAVIAKRVKGWEEAGSPRASVEAGATETAAAFITRVNGRIGLRHSFHCLPDTVDPRGPKSK